MAASLNTTFSTSGDCESYHGGTSVSSGIFHANGGCPFNGDEVGPLFALVLDPDTGETTLTFDKSNINSPILACAELPTGEYLLGSYSGIKKFNADGTVDPTFTTGNSTVRSIVLRDDYYLAGTQFFGAPTPAGLGKYAYDGTLLEGPTPAGAYALPNIADIDGRLFCYNSESEGVVVALNEDLTRDTTFTTLYPSGGVRMIARIPGGYVLCGGFLRDFSYIDAIDDNGALVPFDCVTNQEVHIAVPVTGGLLIAGYFTTVNGTPTPAGLAVIGYDGSLIDPMDIGLVRILSSGPGYLARRGPSIYCGGPYYTPAEPLTYGRVWRIDGLFETNEDREAKLVDTLMLGTAQRVDVGARIQSTLHMLAAEYSTYEGGQQLHDVLALSDAMTWVLHLVMQDNLLLGGEVVPDGRTILRLASRLVLSGKAVNLAEALVVLADALALHTVSSPSVLAELHDGLSLSSALASAQHAIAQLLDQVLFSDSVSGNYSMVAVVRDTLVLSDGLVTAADLAAVLNDSISLAATLRIDNGEYIAWVLNAESAGLSRYTNYPFNSFACIGGKYFGATGSGIYSLDGDDDDGVPIQARLRLGLDALGSRLLKNVPEAFIGYTSSGTLLMRVITVDDQTGKKIAALYKLAPRAAGTVRENRFKFGRGFRAVDWDFVIENVDGADFDISSVEFHPLFLSRRTRG